MNMNIGIIYQGEINLIIPIMGCCISSLIFTMNMKRMIGNLKIRMISYSIFSIALKIHLFKYRRI